MEKITSKVNDNIKGYIKLASQRAYREKCGLFAAEGEKLIIEAIENGVKIKSIFVTEELLKKSSLLSEKLNRAENVYIITGEVADKMSDTSSPQGVFAVCHTLSNTFGVLDIQKGGKYILLADLQDSGNVGTIIRCAEAFGISGVIITKKTCDIYNPKTLRSTTGSIFRMPVLKIDDAESFAEELNRSGVTTIAAVVQGADCEIPGEIIADRSVVLIGNEGNGLTQGQASACKKRLTIKMNGRAESLNASAAAAILMWEMTK